MHADFQRLMQDATRLTHEGDLNAAMAAIQAALANKDGHGPTRGPHTGLVIDVEARLVPDPDLPGTPAPARDPGIPAPEAFIPGRFGPPGLAGRDYKLYIPPDADARPRPLVVMLHGCTQHPDDFAAGTAMNAAARDQGLYVLYPAQSDKANPQRCWNWFKHSHQQRGKGEPALIAGMVRQVMGQHAIDRSRVYVAGLSAGGAMAAILGQTYPDLFVAVGVHSGLAAGAARDLPSALEAMKKGAAGSAAPARPLPTIVIHGDADRTVHPANGEHAARAGTPPGTTEDTEVVQTPSGRRATRRVHRDAQGHSVAEHWTVHGAAHAWSGGSRQGSHTDPQGPDATAAMLRFFLAHSRQP